MMSKRRIRRAETQQTKDSRTKSEYRRSRYESHSQSGHKDYSQSGDRNLRELERMVPKRRNADGRRARTGYNQSDYSGYKQSGYKFDSNMRDISHKRSGDEATMMENSKISLLNFQVLCS